MKKLIPWLFAAFALFGGNNAAEAQCTGVFPTGSLCGNPSTSASGLSRATRTPALGASGVAGSLTFGNATSGLITLQPVTGALGTVTLSLPAATDTLVGKATTDTFTNKTYDTAGTGNSFLINGLAATANTGTGAIARATNAALTTPTLTSPTLVMPAIGVATGTSLALNGCTLSANAFCATGTAAISSTLTSAAHTITSTAAAAFAVGRQGATNPVFQVDASTGTVATGINITGAAAGGGLALSVISSGTNENLTVDAKGSGTIVVGGTSTGAITLTRATTISSTLASAAHTITSASAAALSVGLSGATNPAFLVDASTASSATGLKVKSAAAAGGLALSVITSGTNENLTIDAAAAGTITVGGVSTGNIILTRAVTLTNGLTSALPIASGGTAQVTTVAARGASGLNVFGDSGTSHGNADATVGNTERIAYTSANFTAARTWTLPAANVTGAPYVVLVSDIFGAINGANTLTVQRAGADTINGVTTVAMSSQYAALLFVSNGSSLWTYYPVSSGGGGGSVTQVACNNGAVCTTITTTGTVTAPGAALAARSILGGI